MNLRIIKIVTPYNELISVDLGGEEKEFLGLLSILVGIPASCINGLKDSYGNYFTISSAIKNSNINSEYSEIFYLVCNTNQLNDNSFNLNKAHLGQMKPHFNNLYYNVTPNQFQRNQLTAYHLNNNKAFNNQSFNQGNLSKSVNKNYHQMTRGHKLSDTFSFAPCQNLSNTTNTNLNQSHNSPKFIDCQYGSGDAENYISVAQTLYDSNHIDRRLFTILNQLILKDNQEVTSLLKIYSNDIIDVKSLVSGLTKIAQKYGNNITQNYQQTNRMNTTLNTKARLFNFIDQIEIDLQFNDSADFVLLKNLVEDENEFIIGAYEVYEADNDLENFIESVKNLINKSQNKVILSANNLNTTTSDNSGKHQKSPMKGKLKINCTSHPNFNSQSSVIIKEGNDNLNESNIFKARSSPVNNKSVILSKETETQIMSCLHTEERIIFKYALRRRITEIEIILQLYETFRNTDLLIKPVKLLFKKFVNDIVLKNADESIKANFFETLKNREQNKGLVTLFKEFNEHPNIDRLGREIENYLKARETKLEIKIRDKKISSDSESMVEPEESLMKEQKKQNPDAETTNSVNVENFINLINNMKYLKPEEKRELERIIKDKNKMALEVVDSYYKNKSITSLKASVFNLLKKRTESANKGDSGARNSIEECKKTSSGRIISKLENAKLKKENENTSQSFSPRSYTNLETLLDDLERTGKISSLQQKYIIQRMKNNDDVLNSAWEFYQKYSDLPELIESLKVFASNFQKGCGIHMAAQQPPVTPADLKESKRELIEFLKSKSKQTEKEAVKKMQFNMIKLLARDDSIEKNNLPMLKEMIIEENPLLISAFEVFGVTKDHKDFAHTINILSYLYSRNGSSQSVNSKKEDFTPVDTKETKFSQLFESLIHTSFSEKEKENLRKKFSQKNQFLMSSLEFYQSTGDAEEFLDTLKIILKNQD